MLWIPILYCACSVICYIGLVAYDQYSREGCFTPNPSLESDLGFGVQLVFTLSLLWPLVVGTAVISLFQKAWGATIKIPSVLCTLFRKMLTKMYWSARWLVDIFIKNPIKEANPHLQSDVETDN